jgi:hypothetical protein
MRIRVFTQEDRGLGKYLNFLRLEMGGGSAWDIQMCNTSQWIPQEPADIHLYIDIPLRMGVPWAGFNAFACLDVPDEWSWTRTEMDMMVDRAALEEKEGALKALRAMIRAARNKGGKPTLPVAPLKGTMPPKVGLVTVTRNRPEWFFNMVNNVQSQQWPISRLEWIIVDDGDPDKRLQGLVYDLEKRLPALTIKYVMLKPDTYTVGAKRNKAVEASSPDTMVFVTMDDDDHYPASSVAVRASWLTRPGTNVAYCGMIPMYDIPRYISAINVPPLEQPPAWRVSEATLAFTREAWERQQFPDRSMAEGEDFIAGREAECVEIPPLGVIVSFIHKGNSSSRRVPAAVEANGCHYGFSDDYFRWISECGGSGSS